MSRATAHPGLPRVSASTYAQNIVQMYEINSARLNGSGEPNIIVVTNPTSNKIPCPTQKLFIWG